MNNSYRKAIFLDRDGVINDLLSYTYDEKVTLITKEEDIKLIPRSAEAIKLLNKNNIPVFIITNQPQIARGLLTKEEVEKLNDKIINKTGAKVTATYYCPHHPTKGINKYKKECTCRKPQPGLILKAIKEHAINPKESYMIGDKIADIKAGYQARCKTIGVKTGYACNEGYKDAIPDFMCDDLYDAVTNIILKEKELKLFINTGGKGTRIKTITKDEIPKPMIKVNNKPIIHHLVEWGKKNSIQNFVFMNGYKADIIQEYFKDGKDFNVNITHITEPTPLGSGGAIKFARQHINDTFVYISGDHLCEVNLKKMREFHKENNADMTVLVHESSHPEDSDILKINEQNKVVKFIAKNDDHTHAGNLSNAGLCIIEPRIIQLMDKEKFTFETYIYPKALVQRMNIVAYKTDEYIADIGTPERLRKAKEYMKRK